jgi:cytochrome c-type biogenesis protein CcmF
MFPVELNGMGFNPILQDPALAIHPPLLYIGYVGFSAAFSLGIASMSVSEKERVNWHSYMKPFVVAAWSFLTLGIALGSIWAYYELGWGGWWFWDPVENASLMPWLLGTALIHSLITVEKKKSLQTWVLLLSILTFLLSVTGTFLVRSGILTSVHTFALDPERGIYILAFIALLGGYSLLLYGLKSKNFLNKNYLSFLSREGLILANNIIMMIVCATVFLGTMYPLLIEAFSNNKISVGEPYFNSTVVPIMIPAILIMGIGPILSWGDKSTKKKLKILSPAIFLTFISTIIFIWLYNSFNLFGIIGTIMSFWIISNIIVTQIQHLQKKFNINKIKTNIIPKSSLGMTLAHLGIGLLILGITGSSVWQKEKIVKMNINDETFIHDYKIIFKEVKKNIGPNYIALQGNFLIYTKNNQLIAELKPENRFYPVAQNSTTEASIHTNIFRDLYIVLGDGDINNGWIIRIYYNPLVIWIWIGVVAIFVGGLFSLKKNIGIIKKIPV